MDTAQFDAKIEELNKQLASAQSEIDSDPLALQMKALQNKGANIQNIKDQIADIQSKKDQAVSLQAEIDDKAQRLVDLKESLSTATVSNAEAVRLNP